MKLKKSIAAIVAVILCAATLCACGTSTPNPSSSQQGPSASQQGPSASQPGPSSGEEVVYYMCTSWEESWWDPALYMSVSDASLSPMIYENLVALETDGSIMPQLAEKWEVSADGLTYTFNLRQGVQWHKGYGEFTSEDVKFTFERQTDPAVGSVNAGNLHVNNIESIDCPDKYTVVFNLKQPDVDLLYRFALYYGIIVCKAHNDKNGVESINKDPIGTGPFVYDTGTLKMRTEAVRNREWWGDFTGNIDRVVSTLINDTNVTYSAFDNKELTGIGLYDKDKIFEYEAKGANTHSVPLMQLLYIGINMQLAPFDDPLVREALFYAIDVDYYQENLFHGTESTVGSYLPPGSKYALAEYFKPTFNAEKSKELLAQAGYPGGCNIRLVSANDSLGQPPAIMALDMLGKAGFIVDFVNVDFGVFIGEVRNGTAQAWVAYNTTGKIGDDTIIRYTSEYYPGNNWCGVMDAEYDEHVAAGVAATDQDEKFEHFYAAQKRMIDLQVIFPVSTFSIGQVQQDNVTGFKAYGDQASRLQTVTIG